VLSLEKTRKLLGLACPMSDEELTALLDQLGRIADIALDAISCGPTDANGTRDPKRGPQ
jgi:hypothetical protein